LSHAIKFGNLIFLKGFHQGNTLMFLIFGGQKVPHPSRYESGTGTGWFSVRNSVGGPRLPNTSIVINVPVLQQGHFLALAPASQVFRLLARVFLP
jgi:hypothetical protein